MEKKPIPLLRRLEFLILLLLFLIFLFWTVRKCNATRDQYQQRAAMESTEEEETETPEETASGEKSPAPDTLEQAPAPPAVKQERVTPLYVTVDGLNMRSRPKVGSEVIATLRLHEEVYFAGEVTSFRDSLNLGNGIAYEPWIKVRHAKGRSGWVFGSGVSYYKK